MEDKAKIVAKIRNAMNNLLDTLIVSYHELAQRKTCGVVFNICFRDVFANVHPSRSDNLEL